MRHPSLALLIPAALAACSSGTQEPAGDAMNAGSEPAGTPSPPVNENPIADAAPDGQPFTAGQWYVEQQPSGTVAKFGPPQTEATLMVACDRASQEVTLTRAGSASAVQTHVIESGGRAARIDMAPGATELPTLTATVAPNAPVFAGFVQPGGAIMFTDPEGEVLRVPSAPGIRHVFEDCSR